MNKLQFALEVLRTMTDFDHERWLAAQNMTVEELEQYNRDCRALNKLLENINAREN